jgi:TDG/mug DNA glycosylase family protein
MTRGEAASRHRRSLQRLVGFEPVVGDRSTVLILGSMPSRRSLEAGEYYAHPRNAFWPIMDALGLASATAPYALRLETLVESGIALWDTLARCEREGSLDTRIDATSEEANDFATFFSDHPTIARVIFNGAKAESAFQRHVHPTLAVDVIGRIELRRLPSTSPAHAIPFQDKFDAWREGLS